MKLAIKTIGLLIGLASSPAAADVAVMGQSTAVKLPAREIAKTSTIYPKDQRRLNMDAGADAGDRAAFMQSSEWGPPRAGPRPDAPEGPPPAFGPPPHPAMPGFMPLLVSAMAGSFMPGPPPLPPSRMACEEQINLHAALTGYVKAKLRLRPDQKGAWNNLEQAIEDGLEKIRQTCSLLPNGMVPPPELPEALQVAEKSLSARAAFIHGMLGPLQALYAVLTPEQRMALRPPFVQR